MKIIFSQRLAAYLMARGFVLQRTEPDKRQNGRNIFVFHASEALEAAISDYIHDTNR